MFYQLPIPLGLIGRVLLRLSWRVSDKVKRVIFIVLGTLFLGIGCIGIVLPILPTTPFLLLAAACYVRGSKRIHRWMMSNRIFGEFISNYLEGKGIKPRQKLFTLTLLWLTITLTIVFLMDNILRRVFLFLIALIVSVHILKLPTFTSTSTN